MPVYQTRPTPWLPMIVMHWYRTEMALQIMEACNGKVVCVTFYVRIVVYNKKEGMLHKFCIRHSRYLLFELSNSVLGPRYKIYSANSRDKRYAVVRPTHCCVPPIRPRFFLVVIAPMVPSYPHIPVVYAPRVSVPASPSGSPPYPVIYKFSSTCLHQ